MAKTFAFARRKTAGNQGHYLTPQSLSTTIRLNVCDSVQNVISLVNTLCFSAGAGVSVFVSVYLCLSMYLCLCVSLYVWLCVSGVFVNVHSPGVDPRGWRGPERMPSAILVTAVLSHYFLSILTIIFCSRPI